MNEVQQAVNDWIKGIVEEAVTQTMRSLLNEVLWETVPKILEEYTNSLTDPLPRLYTKEEVCRKLSICPATYHNWINSGKITEIKLKGRVYVDAKTLDRALDRGTICKGGRKMTLNDNQQQN